METPPALSSSTPFNQTVVRSPYHGPKPVVLLILDGWGMGPSSPGNAIAQARTPNLKQYWVSFPHTQLTASGEAVGLPHGEDGNTETGHVNIGAGSIVYQDLPRINMAIADGTFGLNPAFQHALAHVQKHQSSLHLMGLIGAGGVHSNIEHLYALITLCAQHQIKQVYIHGFTDGRDSPATAAGTYVQQIQDFCQKVGVGQIASLMGRYYAMDRDRRWERIERAYHALTLGSAVQTAHPVEEIQAQYQKGVTDEFLEPMSVLDSSGQIHPITDNDAVIFFNYRVDRPRELTRAFVLPDFEHAQPESSFDPYTIKYQHSHLQDTTPLSQTFQRKKVVTNLFFVTMTKYEDHLPVDVAFPPQLVKNPLGKILSDRGLRQLRVAETEKERFVTFYMNGQLELTYPGEDHLILPSKGTKSYDQTPEMSAQEITEAMLYYLHQQTYDVMLCNFANADMVAHTGNLEATIRACEILDGCIGKIVSQVMTLGGVVLITADHGNAEELINPATGEVDTEHSTSPVPLMIIGKQFLHRGTTLPSGILADVAPTLLGVLGIPKPETMTGRSLLGQY